MDVSKFFETLARIVAEKENVQIKVHTKRKEVGGSDNTDEPPKQCASGN